MCFFSLEKVDYEQPVPELMLECSSVVHNLFTSVRGSQKIKPSGPRSKQNKRESRGLMDARGG